MQSDGILGNIGSSTDIACLVSIEWERLRSPGNVTGFTFPAMDNSLIGDRLRVHMESFRIDPGKGKFVERRRRKATGLRGDL